MHFDDICAEELSVCSTCDISGTIDQTSLTTTARVRRQSTRLSVSIVMESEGDHNTVDTKTAFRQHVYLPVMDSLLSELTRCFDSTQCAVMRGQAINPSCENFADLQQIKPDISDLQHELHQAKRKLERLTYSSPDATAGGVPSSLVAFVSYIDIEQYGEAFQELYRLGRTAVSLPVSTASCERIFSAIRRHGSETRPDSRLCHLAVLAIKRERSISLSVNAVVDASAAAHKNRHIALL